MAWCVVDDPEILAEERWLWGLKVEGTNVYEDVVRNWWPRSTVSGSVAGCNRAWWKRLVDDEGQSVEGLVGHLKGFALDPVCSECLQDLAQKAPQQSLPIFLLQNHCGFSSISTLFLDYMV